MRKQPPCGSYIESNGANGIGQKITNFHYPNMVFKPVPYMEFPKLVVMEGYESVIVDNAEQEAVLRARPPAPVIVPKPPKPSQIITFRNGVQVVPVTVPKVWWKRICLWLSIKLEELSR